MDKQSIQEWGWIVVIIILLALIIAFARPFGMFITTGISDILGKLEISGAGSGGDFGGSSSLKAPENLNIKEGILTFDPVDGATGYTLKVGDTDPFDVDSITVVNDGKVTVNLADVLSGKSGSVTISVNAFNDNEDGPATEYSHLVPGLYATGSNYTDLITPWNELVANGVVSIMNGAVYSGFDENSYINLSSDALAGDLALPSGGEITSFADNAFVECYDLTGITIPNTVTTIGKTALAYSTSITEITIPKSVTFIDEDAFDYMYIENVYYEGTLEQWCQIEFVGFNANPCYYCPLYCNGELVEDVVLPKTITTLSCAFSGCSSLKSIVIPNTITSISDAAFRDCENLQYVTLPDTITHIGEEAFAYCYSLKEIDIPDGVTSIGWGAFNDCDITEIVMPDNITVVDDHMFGGCGNLKTITISANVTRIGERVFYDCENFEKIIFKGSVEDWSNVVVEYEWDAYTSGVSVECTNGTIAKGNVLSAPNTTITGDILTIPAVANAHSYKIYVDGVFKTEIDDSTFDLSTLGLSAGSYRINVSAKAVGYTSSPVAFDDSWSGASGRYLEYIVD